MYVNILTIRCLFVLTLHLLLDGYNVQHVMAQTCTNPTPLTEGSTLVDTSSASLYFNVPYGFGQCQISTLFGVWYTVINPTNDPIEYTISTDFPENNIDTDIGILTGPCTNLVCLGGNDDVNGSFNRKSFVTFTAAPLSPYYIFMITYGTLGTFEVSLSRASIPTNPPTKQPTHTPTTSPTKQPSVSPSTTPTIVPSKSPSVFPTSTPTRDCDITYNLYNSRTDQFVSSIIHNRTLVNSLPPCGRVNIEAVVPCGVSSPNDSVIIELYRGTRLFARRTEYYEKYFLFGNNENNIYDGKIPSGTYSIRTIVDGITSPFTNFTMGGRCK